MRRRYKRNRYLQLNRLKQKKNQNLEFSYKIKKNKLAVHILHFFRPPPPATMSVKNRPAPVEG